MFERFTADARILVVHAQEHARRLGHRYIGGEHILLAAVSTSRPASEVMRAHGVTPELVEEEIVRRVGLGAGAGLFGGLDRDALATIGIDLDAVRARIEASFGPQALSNAAQAAHPARRRRPRPRAPRVVRTWRRRRRARRGMAMAHAPAQRPPEATGRYHAPGAVSSGHIPFTPASKKILELAAREADALNDAHIGVEHIALVLTTVASGIVPPILSAAGAPGPVLRAAILDRYRQAS
jgi:Clp amino terminal domain, pathogenicity island component